jgi:hypothetical protein
MASIVTWFVYTGAELNIVFFYPGSEIKLDVFFGPEPTVNSTPGL